MNRLTSTALRSYRYRVDYVDGSTNGSTSFARGRAAAWEEIEQAASLCRFPAVARVQREFNVPEAPALEG